MNETVKNGKGNVKAETKNVEAKKYHNEQVAFIRKQITKGWTISKIDAEVLDVVEHRTLKDLVKSEDGRNTLAKMKNQIYMRAPEGSNEDAKGINVALWGMDEWKAIMKPMGVCVKIQKGKDHVWIPKSEITPDMIFALTPKGSVSEVNGWKIPTIGGVNYKVTNPDNTHPIVHAEAFIIPTSEIHHKWHDVPRLEKEVNNHKSKGGTTTKRMGAVEYITTRIAELTKEGKKDEAAMWKEKLDLIA